MKKIITLIALSLLLCSCTDTRRRTPPITEQSVLSSEEYVHTEPFTETIEPEISAVSVIKENIDYAAFDEKIAQYAADNSVVGMGLCVFAEGKVIYETDLGFADKENGIPCDENTIYRVASVSKLISSMALMTLYDEGLITPYSDLEELTSLPFNNPKSDERVLLWHLMTHTAGLNDSYVYEISPSYYYSVSYVLNNSYNYFDPGEKYSYTNFGLGTVGSIVEVMTGEYFHDFADRVIFSELDMDAAYCADLLEDRSYCANIYSYGELSASPKSWGRTTEYYETFELGSSYLTAQCELLISPRDLARLGIVIAGDGSVDGVRILSKEAVTLINTVYYQDGELDFDVGLSTRIYDNNLIGGRRIFGHSGSALGNVCGLYYDPSDHTGIALCTNGCYLGQDPENGVYDIIEDCIKCVYDTFFEAPANI